jgi:hypothetical protein
LILAVATPAFGQPADETGYDLGSTTELRGLIAQAGAVPGGVIVVQLDVPDGKGQVERWTVTLGKATDVRGAGVTGQSLAPGLELAVTGNPALNAGERRILAQKITCADGSVWVR